MDNAAEIIDNTALTPEQQLSEVVADHHLREDWEASSSIREMRYVLKTPSPDIEHSLTASTLAGGSKILVPPFVYVDDAKGSLRAFYYLGSGLGGHHGMLHGGVFAVLLDECMGRASFAVLPNHIGVTASMDIAYSAPIKIPGIVIVKAVVDKLEGRKAWVAASMESPDGLTVFAKAKALFIEPRGAESMNQLI